MLMGLSPNRLSLINSVMACTVAAALGVLAAPLISLDTQNLPLIVVPALAAALLHVVQKDETYTRHFGKADSDDAMFLLGSISKPINVTAVMTLFDKGKFQLDDPVKKHLPDFTGDGRDDVTIRHLLTHVSGLPDQLPNNDELRKQHASLAEFAKQAMRT